jgi:hypothetical protein
MRVRFPSPAPEKFVRELQWRPGKKDALNVTGACRLLAAIVLVMSFLRVRMTLSLLVAFVTIASGSTAVNAAPDSLRGDGKAIVRIDAPKIKVEKVAENQYRITLPASAKGQWLGTRNKTLMIGALTARDLVNGWSSLGHKSDTTVPATLKWKRAGAKVQFIPAQVTRAKKLADGRTMFEVTSEFPLPSQLTDASLNLARASGPSQRSYYPLNQTYSFTDDVRMLSVIQGDQGPIGETLQSTQSGTCWKTTLISSATINVSCNGTSVSGSLNNTYTTEGAFFTSALVIFNGTLGVNGLKMSYSATIATWTPQDCATCGNYDVT